MVEIQVSSEELRNGALNSENQASAVRALREDGIVVLADIVDLDHIRILRERMVEDIALLKARKDAPFNWNPGNLQQDPPPFPPYLFRDVLVNDVVINVTKAILGKGLKNAFYSGNTALQSESRQPVHADMGQLWPDQEVAHPAYALVVNVPLVDMSSVNGSTEMWPGTHLDTTVVHQEGDIKVPADVLERRAAVVPPVQPTVRAGSIVIRDIRMWHAGMPNHTPEPRPMIAMIHWVSWFPTHPLRFPKGTESLFEHPDLYTQATFTEDPIDHISAPGGFEYDPATA